MAKFDITKEIYKESTIDSTINKDVIISDISMKSKLTKITTKRAYFNMLTKKVDSILNIYINKKPLKVHIKGDVNKPKINVDVKSYFQNEAKKQAEEQLKKVVPENTINDAKKIMKMFN
jgi:hypothetical protein